MRHRSALLTLNSVPRDPNAACGFCLRLGVDINLKSGRSKVHQCFNEQPVPSSFPTRALAMHSVPLLTPSRSKDLERFALLCDSIDACLTGYTRHYVIVNDDDVPLFEKYQSEKRVAVPVSRYLPKWLWAVPPALRRSGRRVWVSLLSKPVHGWHVQQIAKIAGVLDVPEERVCIID